MKKLSSLLAILVMLPLVALGSSLGSADVGEPISAIPAETGDAGIGEAPGYNCCWVFFGGRWHCIPC